MRHGSGDAIVIGAGLAGAAAASALARRGRRVLVLDAADSPAAGASGLPAGLLAPHLSEGDGVLSRLTREGVDATIDEATRLKLVDGRDIGLAGVLHARHGPAGAAAIDALDRAGRLGGALDAWQRRAEPSQLEAAGLDAGTTAVWHPRGGWVVPGALVRGWLADDGVRFRGVARVARIDRAGNGDLTPVDANGDALARAPLVVIAAALGSDVLLPRPIDLQAVRGQVAIGRLDDDAVAVPPFPVNGDGHFVPGFERHGEAAWLSGSTYGRGETGVDSRPRDTADNLARLARLLPTLAARLGSAPARLETWAGVRCASQDRRPLVGEVAPGLWAIMAMGSRGLSFAAICARHLAARLDGEASPLPPELARGIDISRQITKHSR